MAAAEQNPTVSGLKQKVLEEYLTCVICSDIYENPHQLECQHTFCLKCLQTYTSRFVNSFPCPICRNNILIHGRNPAGHHHLFMENMLSFFKNIKDINENEEREHVFPMSFSKFCTICDEERSPVAYCPVCLVWLCSPCTTGHQKLAATKSHTLMPSADFTKFIENLIKENCQKMVQLEEDIEQKIGSLQSAYYACSETSNKIETRIEIRFLQLQKALEDEKNGLLTLLRSKSTNIYEDINKSSENLEKILERVCEVKELYENLQNHPESLQESQIDDLDKASKLLMSDYSALTGQLLDVESVPVVEYLSTDENFKLHGNDMAFGNIFVRHGRKSLAYTGDGVIRLMKNSASGYVITDIATFDDKNYILVSGGRVFHFSSEHCSEISFFNTSKSKNFSIGTGGAGAFSVAKVDTDKILMIDVGDCNGSGKMSLCQRKKNTSFGLTNVMMEGLTSPRGVTVGLNGLILLCDQFDRCVYMFHLDGKLKKIIKYSRDGSFLFTRPMYVAQNLNGDIIVSDHGSFVKILNLEGEIKASYVSTRPESEFWGVTTDNYGNILVADFKYGIHILNGNGQFQTLRSDFPVGMHPVSIDRHPTHNTFMIGTASGEVLFMN